MLLGFSSFLFAQEIRISKTTKPREFIRDNKKEVVVNIRTNLMWQDDVSVQLDEKNWYDAKSYCENLVFADYSNWLLPSHKQLLSIVDKSRVKSAINKEFKHVALQRYWSSSLYVGNDGSSWFIHFFTGDFSSLHQSAMIYVRCVRQN